MKGTGASTGQFIHKLLEKGVNTAFNSKDEFLKLAEEMMEHPDWKGKVDSRDVEALIDVFWARNKEGSPIWRPFLAWVWPPAGKQGTFGPENGCLRDAQVPVPSLM